MTKNQLDKANLNYGNTTPEENYLKAIFKLSNELRKEVPTDILADHLSTKA